MRQDARIDLVVGRIGRESRKQGDKQSGPGTMRDPATVNILTSRVRRNLRDHLAQWFSTLETYQTLWGI